MKRRPLTCVLIFVIVMTTASAFAGNRVLCFTKQLWHKVSGAITSTGDVKVNGNMEVTGTQTSGAASILLPVVTSAGDISLTAAQCYGTYVEITSTGEVELPAGVLGMNLMVRATGAFPVSVDSNGTQVITLNGSDLAGGNKITSTSTANDSVSLVFNGSKWIVLGTSPWTDGGA